MMPNTLVSPTVKTVVGKSVRVRAKAVARARARARVRGRAGVGVRVRARARVKVRAPSRRTKPHSGRCRPWPSA